MRARKVREGEGESEMTDERKQHASCRAARPTHIRLPAASLAFPRHELPVPPDSVSRASPPSPSLASDWLRGRSPAHMAREGDIPAAGAEAVVCTAASIFQVDAQHILAIESKMFSSIKECWL